MQFCITCVIQIPLTFNMDGPRELMLQINYIFCHLAMTTSLNSGRKSCGLISKSLRACSNCWAFTGPNFSKHAFTSLSQDNLLIVNHRTVV